MEKHLKSLVVVNWPVRLESSRFFPTSQSLTITSLSRSGESTGLVQAVQGVSETGRGGLLGPISGFRRLYSVP